MKLLLALSALVALSFGCSSGDDGGGAGGSGAASGTGAVGGSSGAGTGAAPGGGGTTTSGGTGGGTTCTECGCLTATATKLSTDVQPIFTQRCATFGCHTGAAPKEQLSLVAGQSHAQLVGVATGQCGGSRTRVTAGDPAASYLVNKLTGQGMCSGTVMPKSAAKLSAGEIETIVGWICAGAPND